jgi:recombination protein RecR
MQSTQILTLIRLLSKLPSLGPRSGRRIALHLLKNRETLLGPLKEALIQADLHLKTCSTCFNLDTQDPCGLCEDHRRDNTTLCIIEDVADLWALERVGSYKGRYHILGGALSALNGKGPEDLTIDPLIKRLELFPFSEVILALSATVEGQTTLHYICERLSMAHPTLKVTTIAHGVPLGGELDFLDDGTIATAFQGRSTVNW